MKGQCLAKYFFERFGMPTIQAHFHQLVNSISAGLVGRGSDVLGADDALSRDHGWGARFCLFLGEEDFERYVLRLLYKLMTVNVVPDEEIPMPRITELIRLN